MSPKLQQASYKCPIVKGPVNTIGSGSVSYFLSYTCQAFVGYR